MGEDRLMEGRSQHETVRRCPGGQGLAALLAAATLVVIAGYRAWAYEQHDQDGRPTDKAVVGDVSPKQDRDGRHRHRDSDDDPADRFVSGHVTAKSDRSVRIDGVDLALHPRVVIQDDEGRPKQLKDLLPDMDVRYLLKGDQVRQILLVTPK